MPLIPLFRKVCKKGADIELNRNLIAGLNLGSAIGGAVLCLHNVCFCLHRSRNGRKTRVVQTAGYVGWDMRLRIRIACGGNIARGSLMGRAIMTGRKR